MRTILLAILLFVFGYIAFGQRNGDGPPRPLTKQDARIEERNHNCVRHTFKSFSSRLKNYPFNLATQIQLVAFTGLMPVRSGDSVYVNKGLPRVGDSICYSRLAETRILTFSEIDSLTDILYNYGYGGRVRYGSIDMCYDPHNAILFIDKNGKTFAFIEICFMCSRTEESSEKINLGEMCDQKMQMIKNFFKGAGIEYGVTKGPMIDQN